MKPIRIVVHHSGIVSLSRQPQLDEINLYHKSLDFPQSSLGYWVGYGYVIEEDGRVIQTRRDDETQAHTKGYNENSIGICVVGDFNTHTPTPEQMQSLKALLNELCQKYSILPVNVSGHKNFRLTSCPGKLLPDSLIRSLIDVDISQLRIMIDMLTAKVRLLLLQRNLKGRVENEDLV